MNNFGVHPAASPSRIWFDVAFLGFALVVALLAGAMVGLGSRLLDILMIGGLLGLFLLALPAIHCIWILVVLAFLIVGQVTYFGRLSQIFWVPYGIGMLLFFKLPFVAAARARTERPSGTTPLVWPVVVFLVAVLLAIVVNRPPPLPTIAGGKNYITLWSVFFLIALGAVSLPALRNIYRFLFVIAAFQVPLVLYQYLFVAPKRARFGGSIGARWDSIVGGFGGDPMGGGASGAMALFMCFVAFFAIALYRRRVLGFAWMLGVVLTSIVCVGLAEVKVVVVLVPIGIAALMLSDFRRNLLLKVALVPIGLAVVLGILYGYGRFHYGERWGRDTNPVEMTQKAFAGSLDPELINYRTREVGRMAALTLWYESNVGVDPLRTFVGHGPGASRGASILGAGEAAKKFPFHIHRTSAAQMLWDLGLFGFLAFVFILLRGARLALAVANAPGCPPEQAGALEATAAGLLMMTAMLPYGREVLEVPAIALLSMLFLGYVALSARVHLRERRSGNANPVPASA